jgi:hypothetical protein
VIAIGVLVENAAAAILAPYTSHTCLGTSVALRSSDEVRLMLLADFKNAVRALRKSPGFTLTDS